MECLGSGRVFHGCKIVSFPSSFRFHVTIGRIHKDSLSRSSRPPLFSLSSREPRCCMVVKASAAESCTTADSKKEHFHDEDDYLRAGGSEMHFVQLQESKTMKQQAKIADKLPPIPSGNSLLDLIVIGCGPAGLSLAAETAKAGLSVGLVGPDLPFTNNYGVWEDEFKDLGLEGCIEHVWRDTAVYLGSDCPIQIGRAYGRVNRDALHAELVKRCFESGVTYHDCKVERTIESSDGHSLVACDSGAVIPCRLAIVASGAASGKLLEYELGGPKVTVQTAYGIEAEVENNPYDPNVMVFMDYRDYVKKKDKVVGSEVPSFLYAMPLSATRVFFEETCLAARPTMPFDILKKRLMIRLETMGVRIVKVYEEEWSYIPVGGSLPNTAQKNLAFGAAASMVHPATGYSVVRSLSEAPNYASTIARMLKCGIHPPKVFPYDTAKNISLQVHARCRLWRGFLGSKLSSVDLVWFALYMFVIAPNGMRMLLVRHLMSDPSGGTLMRTYLDF
ncbi:unnamed protein product [Victoria cruziana]